MGAVLVIALAFIFAVFIFSARKDGALSNSQSQTPLQSATQESPYISVEHEQHCDRVYFRSAWINSAIREKIGLSTISMYVSGKKPDKSFVKKMESISTLHFRWQECFRTPSTKGVNVDKTRLEPILSPSDGYIVYHSIPIYCHGETFLIASIYKDYEIMLEKEFAFSYMAEGEAPSNAMCISWKIVNGETTTQYIWLSQPRINISFNQCNGKPLLLIRFKYKGDQGEHIVFNFDDNSSLNYSLKGKTTKDSGIIVPISSKDIKYFLSKHLISAQVSKVDGLIEYTIDANEQESLIRFATSFKQAIESMAEDKDFEEWCNMIDRKQAEAEETKKKEEESCWVYLMHDSANNAYKIGISNKPEYRERTLQSEKPSIVKLAAKQFPTRDIARAFEAALHKVYEIRRMRGEWFKLEPNEVEDVKKALE